MRVLIATDKFKGSLTQKQASAAIAEGVRRADPSAEIDLCPLADGGEGTVNAVIEAAGGRIEWFDTCGPLPGMTVRAPIGWLENGPTAVIELATAAGLELLAPAQRDPTRTTTFGVGELLRAAADGGAKKIILGVGGSATCDAGLGIAQAWGGILKMTNGKVYGEDDRKLCGGDLGRVLAVGNVGPRVLLRAKALPGPIGPLLDSRGIEFVVACDVGNPLFGPDGAAHVFAAQKGATPDQVEQLDADLKRFADRIGRPETAHAPGAGAAGGVGFAMMAFFGATMQSGADLIAGLSKLDARVAVADLVITGEGRLDHQTLHGKGPLAVMHAARRHGKPCVALAGQIGEGAEALAAEGATAVLSLMTGVMTLQEANDHAAPLLARVAEQAVRLRILGA